jgi:hypothetical protein
MRIEPPSMKVEQHVLTYVIDVAYMPIEEAGQMIAYAMSHKRIPSFVQPSVNYLSNRETLVLSWSWVTPIDEEEPHRYVAMQRFIERDQP